ncbi:hypothetical protein [Teichococcus aestuarii]|uniref:hypothetical protein n=1 Tax=Teichococcus aestuarii TaxID=568898 RepID=UPI00360C588B
MDGSHLHDDPRPTELVLHDERGRPFLRIFPTGKVHCTDPRGAIRRIAGLALNPLLRTALTAALRLQAERDEGAPQIVPPSTDELLDDPRLRAARQRGAEIVVTMSAGRPARWGVFLAGGLAPIAEADTAAEARSLALQAAPAHPNTVLRVMRIEETIHIRVDEPIYEDEL